MDTTAATMHPAEEYLRNEQNPPVLYVRIYGERRKLFINRGRENVVGIIAKGKRKHGYIFSDWNSIEKIYYPSQEKEDEKDMDRKMILKYQKLARLATHTNDWWKIQCKLPPKTKRFCPLKTFNNAPLKSLDRWGYYYFSLFPSVCSHFTDTFSCQLNPVRRMYTHYRSHRKGLSGYRGYTRFVYCF